MKLRIVINLLMPLLLFSCQRMSVTFNGTTVSDNIKTVTIQNFYSDVSAGPANLSQIFTEQLREYYQRNTRLSLVPSNGDFLLEGSIVAYEVTPVNPQSEATVGNQEYSQIAAQQRLTITVKVSFTNSKEEGKDFEETVSNFADFSATQNLSDVEAELINEIFRKNIIVIFDKTAGDW